MDPSIMKLLEEDEDESMHSAPEVDAFQAALNRDIGGDAASTSMPSDSDTVVSQGSSHTSSQAFLQWQNVCQDENTNSQSQQDLRCEQKQERHSSEMEKMQHGSASVNEQLQNDTPQKPSSHRMQQGQSQDDSQQGKAEKIPSQPPQTTEMQISEKNIIPIREPDRMKNPDSESQYLKLQKMSNQQAAITEKASNPANHSKQVPFALLLPALLPQLDKDRAMQLRKLYSKLRNNEIPKEGFVRLMKSIVGDQMLRLAVTKLPQQPSSIQSQSQSQVPTQQHHHMTMPSVSASATTVTDSHSFAQIHQKGHISPAQVQADSKPPTIESNAKKVRDVEHQSNSHGMQVSQLSFSSSSAVNQEGERSSATIQGLNKQQQQNFHFTQKSFPMNGNGGGKYNPHSVSSVNTPASSLKPQLHESQMRQIPLHQGMGSTQLGGPTHAMNTTSAPKFERQNSINDPKRVQGGPLPHFVSNSTLQQNSVPWQLSAKDQNCGPLSLMSNVKQESVDQANVQQQKSQLSTPQGLTSITAAQTEKGNAFSAPTSVVPSNSVSSSMAAQVNPNVPLGSRIPSVTSPAGINVRTPPKRPSIGQKKPLEALGSSPAPPSKKTKVTVTFLDQSIEQLNDVTAVSGVNLREEEEQLFSGPKEDSRVSEASRRVVQEEEERLILQKTSLKKKLAEIITKCGVNGISSDVERCLSLCVEERMRGLISNLIRLSKQRVDTEKPRHRTVITSDVRQQIMIMNRKAREEWEKKQAEAEKLRKLNEPEDNNGVDGEKEKDEGRAKPLKPNKEDDEKMRTTAANVAARAAVGGDDVLTKWQLMAEQAKQKREGGTDAASGSQPGMDASPKLLSTSGRNVRDNQETGKMGHAPSVAASGAVRNLRRNQAILPQTRVACSICIKDVIAVLEREPQMSKSTLVYRLYERIRSETAAE